MNTKVKYGILQVKMAWRIVKHEYSLALTEDLHNIVIKQIQLETPPEFEMHFFAL